MMGYFTNIVALLFFVSICCGQLIPSFTNTETSVENCGSLELKWEGGTGPYTLSVVETALLSPQTLQTFNPATGTSLVWDVKLPADARTVRVRLSDSTGLNAAPKTFRVTAGTNASCLAGSSVSTSASSTAETSASSTTPAPSAPSASEQSTSALASSSTEGGILVTAAPPSAPASLSTPPAGTPSTVFETLLSTASPTPSNVGSTQQQQTGGAKASGLPVIAIVGIAVGGGIVLIALITLVFCYTRRIRSKSDSLDSWDGGYDPNSVYKATHNNATDFHVEPTYRAPQGQTGYMPYGEKAAGQYY